MDTNAVNTKLALINAAGELFAEHGYEGTSTRSIAEKAKVNIAGIKYHFGSKEGLYLEVINHVFEYKNLFDIADMLEKEPSRLDTKEGLANTILDMVLCCYKDIFYAEKPDWHMKLLMQEVLNNTIGIEHTVEKYFRPKHQQVKNLYNKINPNATTEETNVWCFTLHSQVIFLLHLQKPINILMNGSCDYDEILNQSVKMTAQAMIQAANLSLPKRIQNNQIDIKSYEV